MNCPPRQMSIRDVLSIVLEGFIHKDHAIKTLYQFTSLNSRPKYHSFRNKIHRFYSPLLHLQDYRFIGQPLQYRHTAQQRVELYTTHQTYIYLFTLSQQYDWQNQQPLYDPLTQKCLNRYWRIDRIDSQEYIEPFQEPSLNINEQPLEKCSDNPKTGFYRDGYCNTGPNDTGTHTVCAQVTQPFLEFTKSQGNDLSTPNSYFPGLKPGDYWCLCANRYQQAKDHGHPLKVKRKATHRNTKNIIGDI